MRRRVWSVFDAGEIEAALSLGYEFEGFEIKGPGSRTDSHLFAKVTRAALGMGNRRDGGHVVIGIDDDLSREMLPGLNPEDLASWLSYDDIARKFAEYADPPLSFHVADRQLSSGVTVAVIHVLEFSDTPHLCAKDHSTVLQRQDGTTYSKLVLRKGALYVRPRRVPETSEVASLVEMRDVIGLATAKALRAYIETAERASLALTTAAQEPPPPSDDEKYDAERQRGWS